MSRASSASDRTALRDCQRQSSHWALVAPGKSTLGEEEFTGNPDPTGVGPRGAALCTAHAPRSSDERAQPRVPADRLGWRARLERAAQPGASAVLLAEAQVGARR